jgi:hypothetical protein
MASPHVAGALALVFGRFPNISGLDAKSLLLESVDTLPSLAGAVLTGGRLNAFFPIAEPDSIAPATITDLVAVAENATWVELEWTATGDDSTDGTASRYEVRYSTSAIDSASFDLASIAPDPPQPQPSGNRETMRVGDLAFGTTYHFAVKAFDEFGNASPISNAASRTTLGPPDISVAPESLSAQLLTGQQATRTITITNDGPGELRFEIGFEGVDSTAAAAFASGTTFVGRGVNGGNGSEWSLSGKTRPRA